VAFRLWGVGRSDLLSYAAIVSWPPGSRTQQLTAYQAVPFTGWVAAIVRGRSGIRTRDELPRTRFQDERPKPLGDPAMAAERIRRERREWGSDPQGPFGLGGFRDRCRRPTLGLPLRAVPFGAGRGAVADGAGVEPAHDSRRGSRFPAGHLSSRSTIQAESGRLGRHGR
jgi:hypothetical protein